MNWTTMNTCSKGGFLDWLKTPSLGADAGFPLELLLSYLQTYSFPYCSLLSGCLHPNLLSSLRNWTIRTDPISLVFSWVPVSFLQSPSSFLIHRSTLYEELHILDYNPEKAIATKEWNTKPNRKRKDINTKHHDYRCLDSIRKTNTWASKRIFPNQEQVPLLQNALRNTYKEAQDRASNCNHEYVQRP